MKRFTWNRRLSAVASLRDENRRRLFDFVASAPQAVGRDDAAGALGLARSTASFHLDRLVDDGLLGVEFRKLGDKAGPGSGRPAKLYRAAVQEVSASVPERNYDLAAELLVTAVERSAADGSSAREELLRAAYERGFGAGEAAGAPDFAGLLAAEGYRPADDGSGGLVLLNCPFHRVAEGHAGVVCAMNGAFLSGAAAGWGVDPDRVEPLAIDELRAQGSAGSAQCCARIRPL
ncbi:metalloregulator ArsR/SmtB family transcription factor [Arthrobacter sp. B3I4]|uniref:helix-turn-helix transcriptional regulator n=1 Tax=Arthrobacter sp. B3I4 TaxID=3042267 RepID=UPI0027819EE3|nr:transcriptional regulator [Arthrobacter sp. B3I4]MDQ0755723.1 putative ArsR family transcriptional regulator [Arthrobacter sp. B3I4]